MRRPSDAELKLAFGLLAPYRALASPVVVGLEHVPTSGRLLFVGNRSIYGVLDSPLLVAELWERRRIFPFALGGVARIDVPVWRDVVSRLGGVDDTPENWAELTARGDALLAFPGGGREVAKRKGERYALHWGDKLEFARLAARHAYTIVPFATVGIEDAFDVVLDADDVMASRLGRLAARLGVRGEIIPPIARPGRIERVYIGFAPPVPASWFGDGDVVDDDGARALRDVVREAVVEQIEALHRVRERDPERGLAVRLTARLEKVVRRYR